MSRQVVSPGFFLAVTSYHSGRSHCRPVEPGSLGGFCGHVELQTDPCVSKFFSLRIAKLRGKLKSCGWKIITSPVHIIQSLGNKAGELFLSLHSSFLFILVKVMARSMTCDLIQAQLPIYAAKIGCADFLPKHFTPDMAVYPCVLKPSKVRRDSWAPKHQVPTLDTNLIAHFHTLCLGRVSQPIKSVTFSTLRLTSCFAQGEFGKNSYICNSRDDVHPGIHSWLHTVESLHPFSHGICATTNNISSLLHHCSISGTTMLRTFAMASGSCKSLCLATSNSPSRFWSSMEASSIWLV